MKIAIIPARGGSKRIPNKNIKLFMGKPIIAYSIRAAQETHLFDKIIVSTDTHDIANIAEEYGALVPFMRPHNLADDYTGTDAVVVHTLEWLLKHGLNIQYICCIYATAPLLRSEYIRNGFEILVESNAASVFSITSFEYPIFRALQINAAGRVEMVWPEYRYSRSQDLPGTYHDAGQFYWANASRYLIEKSFFSKDALPVVLPRHLVQDIDTLEDWERAEYLFGVLNTEPQNK